MNRHGGDIYENGIRLDFSASVNPFGMPEAAVNEGMNAVRYAGFYPDPYCTELRTALGKRDRVDPDTILCGAGTTELIYLLMSRFGIRKVTILDPSFSEFEYAARISGKEISHILLEEEDGFQPDDSVVDLIDPDNGMVCFSSPSNPAGTVYSEAFIDRLLAFCNERKIMILADETFRDCCENRIKYDLTEKLSDHPGLIILRAFTKSHAMAGLRFGYMIGADKAGIWALRDMIQPWNVSLPAQWAAQAACDDRQYLKRFREFLREEKPYLARNLKALGFTVFPSEANFFLFRGEPGLAEKLIEKKILIRDCSDYHGLSEGYYRVAVRKHEDNEKLIAALKEILWKH